MARFDNGWIKVHRKILESDIGRDGYCLAVFITLLGWATRQETTIRWHGKPRKIPSGSVVFGLRELAEQLAINKTTIKRKLEYLQKRDTLLLESEPRGTLVTIYNYTQYQCNSSEAGQAIGQTRNAEWTPGGRQVDAEWDTIGEDKNTRREEAVSLSDFDSLWEQYPNKDGKKAAEKHFKTSVKTKEDLESIKVALSNYLASEKVQKGFIKNGSTWFNNWKDWQKQESAQGTLALNPKPLKTFNENGEVVDVPA